MAQYRDGVETKQGEKQRRGENIHSSKAAQGVKRKLGRCMYHTA